MRTMEDLRLIDFVELQLKSKDDFSTAYDKVMSSGLERYLKKFLVIQPGDWPAQFFCRQLVYTYLQQENNVHTVPQKSPLTSTVDANPTPVTSLIPTMGPLHISLNSREHTFLKPLSHFSNQSTAIYSEVAGWLRNLNPGELT